MTQRLFVDALRSVGLVKDGDNPTAQVTLFKHRQPEPVIVAVSEPPAEQSTRKENTVDLTKIVDEALRKQVEDRIADLEKQLADITPAPPVEDLVKEAPDEIRELVAKQTSELAEARAEIAKEREARETREAVIKAQQFPYVAETDALTEVFKIASPEVAGKLEAILSAANERVEMSGLLKQYGVGANDEPADVETKRDQFVTEYLKDNPAATSAVARREFWKQNPDAREEARSR